MPFAGPALSLDFAVAAFFRAAVFAVAFLAAVFFVVDDTRFRPEVPLRVGVFFAIAPNSTHLTVTRQRLCARFARGVVSGDRGQRTEDRGPCDLRLET